MRARMFLAGFLAVWISLPAQVSGQQPPPQPEAAPAPAATLETLKILVLQGQNAVNSIRDGTVTMPVVEVHNENDQTVEGADVLFELPSSGPGGTFPGGKSTISVRSNIRGQAGAGPFMLNPDTGKFVIKVTATLRDRTGHATITQTNTVEGGEAKSEKRRIKWWKVAIVAGAAAVVVGVVLAKRGGGSSSSNTITLTPGPPTFGTP